VATTAPLLLLLLLLLRWRCAPSPSCLHSETFCK
jgi:hypothetical protein